jgi:pilus assembly protein CpaB
VARISPGTMTAAIFAILIGLAGAYTVRQYLKQVPPVAQTEQTEPESVLVPVAGIDLIGGRNVTLADIVIVKLSRDELAKSEYAGKVFMRDTSQISGRVLRNPLKKGEVFETVAFYPQGMGPGVAELLKPGHRAVTVPIKNVGAVEGFARPGSFVDVLYRSFPQDNRPEMTMTLLERVEVLAVGKTAIPGHNVTVGTGASAAGTVTLAALPAQAKALKVVEDRGELTLILRGPDDDVSPVSHQTDRITLEQLLGLPLKRAATMDVYRGAQKQSFQFETRFDPNTDPVSSRINTPIVGEPQRNDATASQPVSSTAVDTVVGETTVGL